MERRRRSGEFDVIITNTEVREMPRASACHQVINTKINITKLIITKFNYKIYLSWRSGGLPLLLPRLPRRSEVIKLLMRERKEKRGGKGKEKRKGGRKEEGGKGKEERRRECKIQSHHQRW